MQTINQGDAQKVGVDITIPVHGSTTVTFSQSPKVLQLLTFAPTLYKLKQTLIYTGDTQEE